MCVPLVIDDLPDEVTALVIQNHHLKRSLAEPWSRSLFFSALDPTKERTVLAWGIILRIKPQQVASCLF